MTTLQPDPNNTFAILDTFSSSSALSHDDDITPATNTTTTTTPTDPPLAPPTHPNQPNTRSRRTATQGYSTYPGHINEERRMLRSAFHHVLTHARTTKKVHPMGNYLFNSDIARYTQTLHNDTATIEEL